MSELSERPSLPAEARASALPPRSSAQPAAASVSAGNRAVRDKGVRPASFAVVEVAISPAPWLMDGATLLIRPLFPDDDEGATAHDDDDASAALDETGPGASTHPLSLPPSATSAPPPSLSQRPTSASDAAVDEQLDAEPVAPTPPARDPHADAFARAVAEHATARTRALAAVEGQLLELAVLLAEVLVEHELAHDPQLHATLARAALSALEGDRAGVVRASRAAHAAIVDAFGGAHVEIDGVKVDVVLDARLDGIGVVVEGPDTRVDGRVSERLRSALRAMSDERRRREEEVAT